MASLFGRKAAEPRPPGPDLRSPEPAAVHGPDVRSPEPAAVHGPDVLPPGPVAAYGQDVLRPGPVAAQPRHAKDPQPPASRTADRVDPWRPVVVGRPVADFPAAPPTGLSYRPDTLCDGWSTPRLHLRLASVRGYQHRYDGRPREDDAAAAYHPETGTVAFAVADGVSDARQPQVGSQLACRSAVDELLSQLNASGVHNTDWTRLLTTVHWQLVEQARRILHRPDADVLATEELLATTLVAGTATPTPQGVEVAVVSVGDSGVWQLKGGRIHRLVGGKDSTADGLVSSTVSPLPRIPQHFRPQTFYLDPGSVVLVGTDGFGDPVGDGEGDVARLFVRELREPVAPLRFAHLLDFSRETFDDDRTLVALWNTGHGSEVRPA